MYDALRGLVRFIQCRKREKHTQGVFLLVSLQLNKCNTSTWVFFTFFKLFDTLESAMIQVQIKRAKYYFVFMEHN